MNYYLIDYENVGSEGLKGVVDNLDAESSVILFYSQNAAKITLEIHIKMHESKAKIQYCKVEADHKNALDFQLASYLGYVIKENQDKQCSYFIVSKDTGFSSLVPFWKERKINIKLVAEISKQNPQNLANELEQKVLNLTQDKKHAADIARIILSQKTKVAINNALMKIFSDTKESGKIYKLIKPLLADKE